MREAPISGGSFLRHQAAWIALDASLLLSQVERRLKALELEGNRVLAQRRTGLSPAPASLDGKVIPVPFDI
jgi:hypothetical protein